MDLFIWRDARRCTFLHVSLRLFGPKLALSDETWLYFLCSINSAGELNKLITQIVPLRSHYNGSRRTSSYLPSTTASDITLADSRYFAYSDTSLTDPVFQHRFHRVLSVGGPLSTAQEAVLNIIFFPFLHRDLMLNCQSITAFTDTESSL